jgi:D-arabinose 1-dehydrogenase-like Zn-dependent alcohol dehydrogenase
MFVKAMGANVTAISHSESKKAADAEKMGATTFIVCPLLLYIYHPLPTSYGM